MVRAPTVAIVACALAPAALADGVTYTFDVTGGTLTWQATGWGSTTSGMLGTFAVTIYQSDGHINDSDTFVLEDPMLANSDWMQLAISGLATFTVGPYGTQFDYQPGDFRLLDFLPGSPGHIGPGGQAAVDSEIYVGLGMNVTGLFDTPFYTEIWSEEVPQIELGFGTSVGLSDVLTVSLAGTFRWTFPISGTATITNDFIFDVVGTAHVVPDPALGGLIVLGVGAAGARLRHRGT